MTEEIFLDITRWQKSTFPKADALSKVHHLAEEIEELKNDIENNSPGMRSEFADCFMLIFGAASASGMDYEDICNAIEEKMIINKLRKWGEPDENGVVKHIK